MSNINFCWVTGISLQKSGSVFFCLVRCESRHLLAQENAGHRGPDGLTASGSHRNRLAEPRALHWPSSSDSQKRFEHMMIWTQQRRNHLTAWSFIVGDMLALAVASQPLSPKTKRHEARVAHQVELIIECPHSTTQKLTGSLAAASAKAGVRGPACS